jgi:hypothetical protein
MNSEIKQWWCDALESGEYKQGEGQLYCSTNNTFCCLGVLTDIYIKKTGLGMWDGNYFIPLPEEASTLYRTWECRREFYLPLEVAKWAEIQSEFRNPELQIAVIDSEGNNYNLAIENDAHRLSFIEISNLIKQAAIIKIP